MKISSTLCGMKPDYGFNLPSGPFQLAHGFELAAGGHDVLAAGLADGRGDAGCDQDATEGMDTVVARTFIRCAGPRLNGMRFTLLRMPLSSFTNARILIRNR